MLRPKILTVRASSRGRNENVYRGLLTELSRPLDVLERVRSGGTYGPHVLSRRSERRAAQL
jgi:hypothetical protein